MATNGSGLAALLAKKKAAENAEPSDSNVPTESARVLSGETESGTVPSTQEAGKGKVQRPANPFANRKDSRPDNSSGPAGDGPATSSGESGSSGQPRPKLASVSLKPESQSSDSDAGGVDAPAINSLDDLDASEDEGIAPRPSMSQFSDETPATKPTRELPEELDKDTLGFIDMIDGVYDVLHEPDLMGGVIRNIIIELKSHPEYMKLVAPDDIRVWVRGMRDSMGLAKIKKQESKSKRSGGSGKKSKLVDADMLADLADLGVDIPE